jgi:hypothetical protein
LKGETIWIVDAHRDDGRRFVVHADEILTAFVELQRVSGKDELRDLVAALGA